MDSVGFFYDQFGFRNDRWTIALLLEMIKKRFHKQSEMNQCPFVDLKKAFDSLGQDLLISKVQCVCIEISSVGINWLLPQYPQAVFSK